VGEIIPESVGGIIPERWATSAGIGKLPICIVISLLDLLSPDAPMTI
jgi:hypothetical protein